MTGKTSTPGISRQERLSQEGLDRLERQLAAGIKISEVVLTQWICRYGEPARELIAKYRSQSEVRGK